MIPTMGVGMPMRLWSFSRKFQKEMMIVKLHYNPDLFCSVGKPVTKIEHSKFLLACLLLFGI